jgi:lipopolysaccharide transport system ATP-binding protein
VRAGDRLRFRHDVRLDVAVGEYTFEIGLASVPPRYFRQRSSLSSPELYEHVTRVCHLHPAGRLAVTPKSNPSAAQMIHFGIANLSGAHAFRHVVQPTQPPDPALAPGAAGRPV